MSNHSKEHMWAILLRLGVNTNAKPGDCRPYEMEDEYRYHEKLFCDKEIWRKVTEYLPEEGINTVVIDINEGVKLDSHPELAVPGSWEKEEFKEELRRLRALGLTPIPKFNFSCAHNAWLKEYAYQIGTDTYRQVCEDIVTETIEIFDNPEFFHLGMDNEETEHQKYSPVQIVRSWKQKTEDAIALFNICLEKGVRPWIWLNAKNVEEYGGEERFKANIPKEVLISNGCYMAVHPADVGEKLSSNTALFNKLDEWGYEQVPVCNRKNWAPNILQTLRYGKGEVSEESIKGYIIAPWVPTMPDYYYELLLNADMLGFAMKTVYPEERMKKEGAHDGK